eukprot:CAMPEP_0197825248 /NCGR_PEP_ID=MMETSP1437-20131217/2360_1 /TAXON_ID=49252 ORGANISM="Eucampia antarctica, Strain CCMP1452" /NCGR_SAMPLE_ID=MMETSP1437 /ASSEMBLY_ACC=CAM_ASM_001096 /LENGTH=233 /DNA_ID=CAMNT_0043425169 /DNA_START=177 /DNA_END=875 /DNA_ORIENTATION=+
MNNNKKLKIDHEEQSIRRLRKLGLCGADDSVSPNMLGMICQSYPFVEFGILFRPDKEGEPRYASKEWVQRLGTVAMLSSDKMNLAAHLCGTRVNDALDGNDAFLSTLPSLGFKRVQINATAVNGVDASNLRQSVPTLVSLMEKYKHSLAFIIQKNEETKPLWEGLIQHYDAVFPDNVTMLVDESKGTGTLASSWPSPPKQYNIGYAGGIGPSNIKNVLKQLLEVTSSSDSHFW